jgi:hypothetical protein
MKILKQNYRTPCSLLFNNSVNPQSLPETFVVHVDGEVEVPILEKKNYNLISIALKYIDNWYKII